MSSNTIRYSHLHKYLTSLGYNRRVSPTSVVYSKKGEKLPIILPKSPAREVVRQSHLVAVEQILLLDGVIDKGQFTRAIATSNLRSLITNGGKTSRQTTKLPPSKRPGGDAVAMKAAAAKTSNSSGRVTSKVHDALKNVIGTKSSGRVAAKTSGLSFETLARKKQRT